MRERTLLANQIEGVLQLETNVSDTCELVELAEMEGDAELVADGVATLRALAEEAKRREMKACFRARRTAMTAIWKSMPGPVARRLRTGPK